jgi:antibiotic biosynthesis monooxygenase (ABM) superfamily enzyme
VVDPKSGTPFGAEGKSDLAMILVVILTIRPGSLAAFRAFEHAAARIMAQYGGTIERAVAIPPTAPGAALKEVHIVTFPSPEAFAAYRADAALQALVPQREASILATEILVGEEGPTYGG